MKKSVLLLVAILLSSLTFVSAQEQDPWVGDWTSESFSDIDWEASKAKKDADAPLIYTNYRLIIRITKNGDTYSIRGKRIKVKDRDYSYYLPHLTITEIEGNKMWINAFQSKEPFRVNGEIEEYEDITWYFRLTLENGGLHYAFYRIKCVSYDRNMRYIDTKDWDCSTDNNHDLMLYNDNW